MSSTHTLVTACESTTLLEKTLCDGEAKTVIILNYSHNDGQFDKA